MSTRILAVLDSYPALSETFLYTTLETLQQAGYEVAILARRRGTAPHKLAGQRVRFLPSEALPLPLRLACILWYALRLLWISPASLLRVWKYLKGRSGSLRETAAVFFRSLPLLCESPDLVYFPFGGLAVKYLEFMQLFPGCFFSLRGSDINIEPLLSETYTERLKAAVHAARRVHCVCRDIETRARALSAAAEGKFAVIYTALDPLFLKEDPSSVAPHSGPLRIVSVGRLDWRKGLEHGMMAIRSLLDRGIDCTWNIIGEGGYRVALEWAVRDMGLERCVTFEGARGRGEVRDLLRRADIFFHPAVHEGLSNAVLEAMALDLPVVVADVGGMREAIRDGENGFLVPPRDWRCMADALERLAGDPALRSRVGAQARADAGTSFSSARQACEFLRFFGTPDVHG